MISIGYSIYLKKVYIQEKESLSAGRDNSGGNRKEKIPLSFANFRYFRINFSAFFDKSERCD
jgi:hypothetical protein